MKVNYDALSWQELRAYILTHRDDLDALEALYARRSPDADATWFSPPKTDEEWQQQLEQVRPLFERSHKAEDESNGSGG